jgi:hypothetical protein
VQGIALHAQRDDETGVAVERKHLEVGQEGVDHDVALRGTRAALGAVPELRCGDDADADAPGMPRAQTLAHGGMTPAQEVDAGIGVEENAHG